MSNSRSTSIGVYGVDITDGVNPVYSFSALLRWVLLVLITCTNSKISWLLVEPMICKEPAVYLILNYELCWICKNFLTYSFSPNEDINQHSTQILVSEEFCNSWIMSFGRAASSPDTSYRFLIESLPVC